MIECNYCQRSLDIDEATAYELGWKSIDGYEDRTFDPPRFYIIWYCPQCGLEYNPCAKSKRL